MERDDKPMETKHISERLIKLDKTRLRLIEFIEIFSDFDKVKADKLKIKLAMIESLIREYKKAFALSYGDLEAKKSVFNLATNNHAVSYHKTSFEKLIEDFKSLIADNIQPSIRETGFAHGINIENVTKTKKYAFKCAYYQLKNNAKGYIETLETYEKFKTNDKARNAGNMRNSYRINRKKYSNALSGDESENQDGFND